MCIRLDSSSEIVCPPPPHPPTLELLTVFVFVLFFSLFLQEGMLNKLQNHVEQEEERWRQQLHVKDSELEAVREENDQLQQSLEQLTEENDQLQESLEQLQGTGEVRV
jgi:septal ring factor EnvC (AmiA/AmiB activator)